MTLQRSDNVILPRAWALTAVLVIGAQTSWVGAVDISKPIVRPPTGASATTFRSLLDVREALPIRQWSEGDPIIVRGDMLEEGAPSFHVATPHPSGPDPLLHRTRSAPEAAGVAHQQADPQPLLQRRDPPADGGLGQPEGTARGGHAAGVDHLDEQSHAFQVDHGLSRNTALHGWNAGVLVYPLPSRWAIP